MDRGAIANGDLDASEPPAILASARKIRMKWKMLQYQEPFSNWDSHDFSDQEETANFA
jgi:hypothetical protein